MAWYRYLTAIRACPTEVYEKTEDAAWQRLVKELDPRRLWHAGRLPRLERTMTDLTPMGSGFQFVVPTMLIARIRKPSTTIVVVSPGSGSPTNGLLSLAAAVRRLC